MRYDCRFGLPHDFIIIHENPQVKWEVCKICNKKIKWNKGYKSRIDNKNYLKMHVRQFAQKTGPTKQIYNKLYNPDKNIIYI